MKNTMKSPWANMKPSKEDMMDKILGKEGKSDKETSPTYAKDVLRHLSAEGKIQGVKFKK